MIVNFLYSVHFYYYFNYYITFLSLAFSIVNINKLLVMNSNQDKSDKLRKWSSEVSICDTNPSNSSIIGEKEKNAGKIRPSSTYDALTFEQHLLWKDGRVTEKYTVRRFHVADYANQLVEQLIDDILEYVVETAERRRREQIVENYLTRAIPAPLVSR